MADGDFSLRRFRRAGQVAAIGLGVVVALVAGPAAGWDELVLRGLAGGLVGFLAAGGLYLVLVTRDLSRLAIPADELAPSEVVVRQTVASMVHYRSGRPLRFWEATGGRLFLTTGALEFRAHRGQPWVYRLTLPLAEVVGARACRLFGVIRGGLRVDRADGGSELFAFGVFGDAPGWAAAVEAARRAAPASAAELGAATDRAGGRR